MMTMIRIGRVVYNLDSLVAYQEQPYEDYRPGPTTEVVPIPKVIVYFGEDRLAETLIGDEARAFLAYVAATSRVVASFSELA